MSDPRSPSCPHGELAVAWALHSLEPAEETLVLAHLPDCADCRQTVAETEEIGAMLGVSVTESAPSAALEQRVLAVTGTPQATDAATDASQAAPHEPDSPPALTPPAPPERRPAPQTPPPRVSPPQVTPPPTPVPGTGRVPEPGSWPRASRPPRRRSKWDPRCLVEPAIMLFVVLLVGAIAVAVVFYGF